MYYYISGKLMENQPGFAVVDCNGVGYKCNISFYTAKQLPKIGERALLYTFFCVREDTQELYGFFDQREHHLFKLLISVSGVGPKAAMALLSDLTPDSLIISIIAGDAKALTKVSGIGKKTAERIVLELKDTLAKGKNMAASASPQMESGEDTTREAINALMVLGYSKNDAVSALAAFDNKDMTLENLIRQALKQLM